MRTAERNGLWRRGWTTEQALSIVSGMQSAVARAFDFLHADSGVRARPGFDTPLLQVSACVLF